VVGVSEPEIIVENRASLHYLLTEAAEIEHGLMCCYLYAAYSLKDGEADGLSAEEAAAVAGFRRTILEIARDEMVHLALVSNLLVATGSAPHWHRQNFPVGTGYHPAGVVVSLAPFDAATLDHFLYLERPEGLALADGKGFEPERLYQRGQTRGRLVPSAQDYETVGHLYRGIRTGLEEMTRQWGPQKVFCGNPRAQVGGDLLPMRGLSAVTDLESALAAIDTIVTQGEGAPGHSERSHYELFLGIKRKMAALVARNPAFKPAHNAARNPVMRRPAAPEGRVWIAREPAAGLLDLGNAVYEMMLRGLDLMFSHPVDDPAVRDAIVAAALVPMHALGPVASHLPRLPATDDDEGPRAGLTFTMTRSQKAFPDVQRGLRLLAESARGLVRGYERVALIVDESLSRDRDAFASLSLRLDALAKLPAAVPESAALSIVAAPAPTMIAASPAEVDETGVETVRGKRVELRFEAKRCIHARHCVLETPEVFLANVKGPWIHPDEAPLDRLIHVARTCPSGAITYRRLDGGQEEEAPPVNLARVRERGPLAVHADLHIEGSPACHRATLCRCGASNNKPFCDGSHAAAGFDATGEPHTIESESLATRGGPLSVTPMANGPLRVRGSLELISGTGRTIRRVSGAMLCRCGGSANKPYCDGTHSRNGFQAPGST
jgi:CDGSH-type Zn-finger protein/uncharacterized Fe-S cluster protein YjdI